MILADEIFMLYPNKAIALRQESDVDRFCNCLVLIDRHAD